MSALENGVPIKTDNKSKILKQTENIQNSGKVGRDVSQVEHNSGHSKSCNGSKNDELFQPGLDADHDLEDTSPDISLSSQKTLRYCDVEPEHINSPESSDSNEILDEHPREDCQTEVTQLLSPTVSLEQNVIKNRIDFSDEQESQQINQGAYVSSRDHHEVIPEFSNVSRPESLSLSHPLQETEQGKKKSDSYSKTHTNSKNSIDSDMKIKDTSKTGKQEKFQDQDAYHVDPDVCLSQNLPQGTITRKGDMIQFVADDLMEKIKKSSPMSHADTASSGSRRSSVRSTASVSSSTSFATSSGVSRSPSSLFQQSPDDIPPIDPSAVIELENHALRVADSLDLMMGNIRNNLHKMSAITIGCQDAYKRSVDITCDSVDASIKSMYTLMAKCEELSMSMKPVDQLAIQIREIKRILDLFEAQMTDK
uniref:BLOC-1-related complex subunit 6 C-terminal helix domain-containing protein n=1 Tax=Arion vulgaris TaxID=1028688 RepID=A0A0B6ZD17_9EUPU